MYGFFINGTRLESSNTRGSVLDESGTDDHECRRKVASGRKVGQR